MSKAVDTTGQHHRPQGPPTWRTSKATVGVAGMIVLISALLSWQALSVYLSVPPHWEMWVALIVVASAFVGSLPLALRAVHRAKWRRVTMWIGHKTALTVVIIPVVIALILIPLTTQSAAYGLAAAGIAFAIILGWGHDKWRYSKGLAVDPFDPDAPLEQRKEELRAATAQAEAVKPGLPYDRDALTRWFDPVTPDRKARGTWRATGPEWQELWATVQWLHTLLITAASTAVGIIIGTAILSCTTEHGMLQLVGLWHVIAWPTLTFVLLPVALAMDVAAATHRLHRLHTLAKELAAEEQVAPATHGELQELVEEVARARNETRLLIQEQSSLLQALHTELPDGADATTKHIPPNTQRMQSGRALRRSIKRTPRTAAAPRLSVRGHRRSD